MRAPERERDTVAVLQHHVSARAYMGRRGEERREGGLIDSSLKSGLEKFPF